MLTSRKRIVIAEDHAILRDGLRAILEDVSGLEVVAEAQDGLEAIRAVRTHQPELLLLDLSMPRMNGLEAIGEIKQTSSRTKILVLTIHRSDEYLNASLRAGADGYALKDISRKELLEAIEAVLSGRRYITPDLKDFIDRDCLEAGDHHGEHSGWDSLTKREREIMKLVAEGYTNRQIAEYLFISPKTVDNHRTNLMRKLKLHSAQALTTLALRKGLLD